MAITFVGGKTHSFNATAAQTISLSGLAGGSNSSPSADDIVIIFHGISDVANSSSAVNVNTSGYTSFGVQRRNGDSGNGSANFNSAYKVMGSTPDASVQITGSATTLAGCAAAVLVFRGIDVSVPIDVSTTSAVGSSSTLPNPSSITPATSGAVIVAGGFSIHARTAMAFGSTDLLNFISADNNQFSVDASIGAGYANWAGGSFDPSEFTTSANPSTAFSAWCARTIALRPLITSVGSVRDGGVWKPFGLSVKDGGVWKPASQYVRDGGVWKPTA